jgi:uncharacterized protein YbbC (DUF1343 family)
MVSVADQPDPVTGLPVTSLYGQSPESLKPTPEQLADLEVFVCDLQDIGSRYYTYVWTVVLCLEACSELGLPVVLCDRPNPLGGEAVEGGTLQPGFESFVGLHPVPVRHGLTIGELVMLARAERGISGSLEVVRLGGWQRPQHFEDCGLPWVMPSPNMPTPDTAFVYPGMCLVEATGLSEGRGTTRPFEIVGAPYVDPDQLARELNRRGLPGVRFRPTWFEPQFQKHAGRACGGVQLHVTDRAAFRPYRTGISLLHAVRHLYPDAFAWRAQAYEFVADIPAIDLLTGSPQVREVIDRQQPLEALEANFAEAEAAFRRRREPYLLYR